MIYGRGLIASSFENLAEDKGIVLFASGVSNSKINAPTEFEREASLVLDALYSYPKALFVYFSTCSVYDPEELGSPYILHKYKIEQMIQKESTNFLIFRVSNVVGKTQNKSTIFSYLITHILNQEEFILWKNAYRNLISIEDLNKICKYFISSKFFWNKIINVANKNNYSVFEIVQEMEHFLNKKAIYQPIEKGKNFKIETPEMDVILQEVSVHFPDHYISMLLHKYYQENGKVSNKLFY